MHRKRGPLPHFGMGRHRPAVVIGHFLHDGQTNSSTTNTPPSNTTGCGSPANTIGQTLQVTGVTDINCQTGMFYILTTGGNGQSISYANNVGLSNNDPTNCVRRLDNPGLVQAIKNPGSDVGPFTLKVVQGATQSNPFTFDFKRYCTTPARVATESLGELDITVLGNPTLGETVEVIIGNTAGEAVTLQVNNAQGQAISRVNIDSTGKAIRQHVELGRSVGLPVAGKHPMKDEDGESSAAVVHHSEIISISFPSTHNGFWGFFCLFSQLINRYYLPNRLYGAVPSVYQL